MSISTTFLNPEHYCVGDVPLVFEKVCTTPEDYATWQDVQDCLNNPWNYRVDILDKNCNMVHLPQATETWLNAQHPRKDEIFKYVNNNDTFVIGMYGHHNRHCDELLDKIEKAFDIHCDIHLYGATGKGSKSFNIHWDQPSNFIMQLIGETHWKVYNERCSTLIKHGSFIFGGDESHLGEPVMDVVLTPGDMIYIPSRSYHCAHPSKNARLSMSIPLWHGLDMPQSDRKVYNLTNIKV